MYECQHLLAWCTVPTRVSPKLKNCSRACLFLAKRSPHFRGKKISMPSHTRNHPERTALYHRLGRTSTVRTARENKWQDHPYSGALLVPPANQESPIHRPAPTRAGAATTSRAGASLHSERPSLPKRHSATAPPEPMGIAPARPGNSRTKNPH